MWEWRLDCARKEGGRKKGFDGRKRGFRQNVLDWERRMMKGWHGRKV